MTPLKLAKMPAEALLQFNLDRISFKRLNSVFPIVSASDRKCVTYSRGYFLADSLKHLTSRSRKASVASRASALVTRSCGDSLSRATSEIKPLQNQERQVQSENSKPKKQVLPPKTVHLKALENSPEVWQNAAVLIDKEPGWTSFDVCAKLRRILNMKKIGHAGTLDPQATGLLIVCTGRGTKSVDKFMAQHKEYTGVMRLGEGTPSFDGESEVNLVLPWEHIEDDDFHAVTKQFTGDIMQRPPMFSAIKGVGWQGEKLPEWQVGGERLYKAARRGETVALLPRPVTVHSLQLIRSSHSPQEVLFSVSCSKGTYIRSLVSDLGKALGSAAYMTALRRTRIGDFKVEDAWRLEDLAEAVQSSQ